MKYPEVPPVVLFDFQLEVDFEFIPYSDYTWHLFFIICMYVCMLFAGAAVAHWLRYLSSQAAWAHFF